jgi:hypothetical protein
MGLARGVLGALELKRLSGKIGRATLRLACGCSAARPAPLGCSEGAWLRAAGRRAEIEVMSAEAEAGLDEVAALVVADHLDIVGGFPMDDLVLDEGAIANGFLNSGSLFRPEQFSALYRSIARDIAGAIP